VGWAIPVLLIVLGVETSLNFIFDIYRPRLKGQYSRSAFDSRLLGSISQPEGIFHTVSSAIDYQFGFKVSQTWFYRLLEKAIVPLILIGAATLYMLSCIVVVEPYEQAIVEHFGKPVRELEPGLSFKWPWPIDKAYKHATERVDQLNIGYVEEVDARGEVKRRDKLWGQAHYAKEYSLMVASRAAAGGEDDSTVPVSFIVAAVPVQYKVRDLRAYLYNHTEPVKVLEGICYRELTKFAASATIETDAGAESESLLGGGCLEAKEALTKAMQASADEAGLGVEIVFVGLQGLHPPVEVAPDYQKVVGAVQKKQAIILGAEAERNKILSELAGSIGEVNALYALAADYQRARDANDVQRVEELAARLDKSFTEAKGRIFETLSAAKAYAYEKETLSRATGERFAGQIEAYRASKEIYKQEMRLRVLEETLKNIRKFVVVPDKDDTLVLEVDVKEKVTPGLYDLGVVGAVGR
jgi:membrane protease subunit HflK